MDYTLLELIEMAGHAAPTDPLTVDQAHETMRLHRECSAYHCPRKMAAFDVLIEAGRIVPDSGRRY
ncbi:hypothetical protein GFY24_01705 [Nocardia sp. SYP-A9097]|uniref:hypothetical protein n=1 Tax=Nocardia sp. SYP-A9097 TaxID=2663237 RepID=UPI00129B118E|nr:hypothetical protein [Nocardia sp. SYP-A9097]MRH86191.1 hypothetical protein [Nocardia sp. SYP-A9097]